MIKKVIALAVLIFIVHEVLITVDGLTDETVAGASVAVVLGSKVNEDGSLSPRLKSRLDKAYELYADTLVDEIYVSGGKGKEGHDEAEVMAAYLIERGVPKHSIKLDHQGINTRSTAVNFKSDYPEMTSVVVVTQFFHVSRTKLAFKQVGIQEVKGVHSDFFEIRDLYSLFREFLGFYKYLIWY